MTEAKVNDKTSFNISISYLIQIIIAIAVFVYGYATISENIERNDTEIKNLRANQNNYIFPDIRVIEQKVIVLEKEVLILQKEIEFHKKEIQAIKKGQTDD
jgi:peptidoglycan hydrolase CwlO-like protein